MLVIGDHLWTYSAIIVLNANDNNKNMACASNAERVTGRGGRNPSSGRKRSACMISGWERKTVYEHSDNYNN